MCWATRSLPYVSGVCERLQLCAGPRRRREAGHAPGALALATAAAHARRLPPCANLHQRLRRRQLVERPARARDRHVRGVRVRCGRRAGGHAAVQRGGGRVPAGRRRDRVHRRHRLWAAGAPGGDGAALAGAAPAARLRHIRGTCRHVQRLWSPVTAGASAVTALARLTCLAGHQDGSARA